MRKYLSFKKEDENNSEEGPIGGGSVRPPKPKTD